MIFDEIAQYKILHQEQMNKKALEQATKLYMNQKGSLMEIRDTAGIKTIKKFFENQKSICENAFRKGVKPEFLSMMQGRYGLTCDFLDFINNLGTKAL